MHNRERARAEPAPETSASDVASRRDAAANRDFYCDDEPQGPNPIIGITLAIILVGIALAVVALLAKLFS